MTLNITWPNQKSFAFTVVDDTDFSTLENSVPVYDFLYEHGFRTTKTVWPFAGRGNPEVGGSTCEEEDYLAWVKELAAKGFEIALHNVTYHTSTRPDIVRGLEIFQSLFATYPKMHVNHTGCGDAIYWGDSRLSPLNRPIYNLLTRYRNAGAFSGHVTDSDKFWGDLAKSKIKYVRNFVFPEINTLKACPQMPYHDKDRPFVNYWFASSEGAECNAFNRMLREVNQDRLEAEGGACIMYTHFGENFYEDGQLNGEFKRLMERLSRKNGWFVPASTLLDYILEQKETADLFPMERLKLEWRWLASKIATGGTS